MSLTIKLSEQFPSSRLTSGVGLFDSIEASKVFMLFLVLDVRDVMPRLLVKRDAFKPACVAASDALVHQILGTGSQPQIGPTIIGAVAVSVIDFLGRPFTSHDEPNQAVGIIFAVVDPESDVSVQPQPSCWLANYRSTREGFFPGQNPGVGIVVKNTADFVGTEVVAGTFVSHFRLNPTVVDRDVRIYTKMRKNAIK